MIGSAVAHAANSATIEGEHFCYSCAQEVPAAVRPDLELQCLQCGGTCVERLGVGILGGAAPEVPAGGTVHGPRPPRTERWQRGAGGHHGRRGGQAVVRHLGIICDGCRARDFAGVRYRCLHCPDFDFCATCYGQRSELHPGHDFEVISTPRSLQPWQDYLSRLATRTSIAIIGIGVGGLAPEDTTSGLNDDRVAWWLAGSRQLVSAKQMAALEPPWSCPICADGLEAESANGWVVQICGPAPDRKAAGTGSNDEWEEAEEGAAVRPQGHVYHEACLRRWLVKSNSCPVCRRRPVLPEA